MLHFSQRANRIVAVAGISVPEWHRLKGERKNSASSGQGRKKTEAG